MRQIQKAKIIANRSKNQHFQEDNHLYVFDLTNDVNKATKCQSNRKSPNQQSKHRITLSLKKV